MVGGGRIIPLSLKTTGNKNYVKKKYLCIAGGGPVGGVVVSVESCSRHPRPGQREAPAMQVRPALPLLQQR